MSILSSDQGFALLDQLGINTDNQLIREVNITISVNDPVIVTIKRYVNKENIKLEEKRYFLTEI